MSSARKITITIDPGFTGAQALVSVARDLLIESRNHKGIRAQIYRQLSEGLSQCSVTKAEQAGEKQEQVSTGKDPGGAGVG